MYVPILSEQHSTQEQVCIYVQDNAPFYREHDNAGHQNNFDEFGQKSASQSVFFFYSKMRDAQGELVLAIEPVLLDLLMSFVSDVRDLQGEAYKALSKHVSEVYFNKCSEDMLLATKEPRYMKLRTLVERAIAEGDSSFIDPYIFFQTLVS